MEDSTETGQESRTSLQLLLRFQRLLISKILPLQHTTCKRIVSNPGETLEIQATVCMPKYGKNQAFLNMQIDKMKHLGL